MHIRKWPDNGQMTLPALARKIRSAHLLDGPNVHHQQTDDAIVIEVPLVDRRLLDTVVVFELDKPVE